MVEKSEFRDVTLELRKTGTETSDIKQFKGYPIWRYSLLVKTEEGQERFAFHGSVAGYQEGTEPKAKEVFEMVLSDAISYINAEGIDDFAECFGYEKVSKTLEAWKGCKKTADKLKKLGFSEDDLFEMANALRDEL